MERVKEAQPIFRPTLKYKTSEISEENTACIIEETGNEVNIELLSLVERCWSDEPAERPDFYTITVILTKIRR